MRVIATNIAEPTLISWKGEEIPTGIFKFPVPGPIQLEREGVLSDTVSDRKVHGGIYKACYVYSSTHYPYWKEQYPDLSWNWGMFGENLTIEHMIDDEIRIGDIYNIGTAKVQVSMPREPCYKLGIKFKDQEIIEKFVKYGKPGAYLRILEPGEVRTGDSVNLFKRSENTLTIVEFFKMSYARKKDTHIIEKALANMALPEYKRKRLKDAIKKGG